MTDYIFAGIILALASAGEWEATLYCNAISHWLSPYTAFCRYLYCDDVSLEADTALPTLYAAKKYIIPHLVQLCVEYLETIVDASNACLLLSHNRILEETELMQRCLCVIDTRTEKALQADSVSEIDHQTLKQILVRDSLGAKETLVLAAAVRWAEAECARQGRDVNPEQCREVLGDAIYLVRFPTMSENEFADCAGQSGLLSKQEITDVSLFFSSDAKPNVQFPAICREGPKIKVCRRLGRTAGKFWMFSFGRVNRIQFSVDQAIFVMGFGLYCSGDAGDYEVGIGLTHNDGTVLCKERHSMYYDGSDNTTHVLFDRPVRIMANTYYTASFVEGSSGSGVYGFVGSSIIRCDDIDFTFKDHNKSKNLTKVDCGQIPEIIFYCWPAHILTHPQ